jgi:hypothetical protein
LARFRQGWFSFGSPQAKARKPAGARLSSPAETPIDKLALPQELRIRAQTAGAVEFLKYLRAVNGKVVEVVDDGSALPSDAELVGVTHSTTTIAADRVEVEAHLLVGRRLVGRPTPRPHDDPRPGH